MSGDLHNLIFGKPVEVPQMFGPSERTYYGGFFDKYVPAEDAKGRRLYVHSSKGYSVWERPETVLGLLLANKYIPNSLRIERWVSIPKSPLIIIDCGDGHLLLANKINGRVKLDVDDVVWSMVGPTVEKELRGSTFDRPFFGGHRNPPSILEVLDNLHGRHSESAESTPDEPRVSAAEKNAFFDALKDNSVPVLGDYEKVFQNLMGSSRDPRLHAVPQALRPQLLAEYAINQKKTLEDQAKNQREKLQEKFRALCNAWQKQYASSAKFKSNFGLFKEKYRHERVLKEAIKYFDLEKIFKESCENSKVGNIPAAMKSSIDTFVTLLRETKAKIGMRGEPTAMLLMAPEIKAFTALSEEDKRRVFEEFKDKV